VLKHLSPGAAVRRLEYSCRFAAFAVRHWRMHSPHFTVTRIPLADINGIDKGHLRIDAEHRLGIDVIKERIRRGERVLPILVRDFDIDTHSEWCGRSFNQAHDLPTHYRYQRLDGFKRWMAYRELGYAAIECHVDNTAFPGAQHKMAWCPRFDRLARLEYEFIKSLGDRVFVLKAS
jgi:hypothetical protein